MFPKNGVGRPVFPHASGGFSRARPPTGHIAAYRDLVSETLSLSELAHRINVRRVPPIYQVSSRLIAMQSQLLKFAVFSAVLVVTPAVLLVIVPASTWRLIQCKFKSKACPGCANCEMKVR